MPGTYLLDLWLNDGVQDLDVISDAISFEVASARRVQDRQTASS